MENSGESIGELNTDEDELHAAFSERMITACEYATESFGEYTSTLHAVHTLSKCIQMITKASRGVTDAESLQDSIADAMISMVQLIQIFGESQFIDSLDLKIKRLEWLTLKNLK